MNSIKIELQSELSELRKLRKLTENFYKDVLDDIDLDRLLVALEEAVSNIILHGYKNYEQGTIEVELSYTENEISISIKDRAPFFDGNQLASNINEIVKNPQSGLGIYLMKKLMQVQYLPQEGGGTKLIMKKINYLKKK